MYITEKQIIKLGLLNIRSLSTKAFFVNDTITDHKLDVLCLTETWLNPDEYIIFKKSLKVLKSVAKIYSNTLRISHKTGFKYNSFEVMVLHKT